MFLCVKLVKSNKIFYFHAIIGVEVSVICVNERSRVTFSDNIFCTCKPSQRSDRKTCAHVLWVFLNLFGLSEDDPLLPQLRLERASLNALYDKCPDAIPANLGKCLVKVTRRTLHPEIKKHPRCNEEQEWVVSRKRTNRNSSCAGCGTKNIIKPNDLYLRVSGLLYRENTGRVVAADHHFCVKKSCVTKIKTKLNNIRNQESMEVTEDAEAPLQPNDKALVRDAGFIFV